MDLYKRIFEKGIFYLKPFPHWIVEDFFEPEELEIVLQYFPSSEKICELKINDIKFLVKNKNMPNSEFIKKAALARLGLKNDQRTNYEYLQTNLEEGGFCFKPGVSYYLQLGTCCSPINSKFSDSVKFDNIIRRLEIDWWELRPKIIQKVREITTYRFPNNLDFETRGDLEISLSKPWFRDDNTWASCR